MYLNYFRLAANEKQYISSIMHIRRVREKQRLIIKAIDIVEFWPPSRCYFNFIRKFSNRNRIVAPKI